MVLGKGVWMVFQPAGRLGILSSLFMLGDLIPAIEETFRHWAPVTGPLSINGNIIINIIKVIFGGAPHVNGYNKGSISAKR